MSSHGSGTSVPHKIDINYSEAKATLPKRFYGIFEENQLFDNSEQLKQIY